MLQTTRFLPLPQGYQPAKFILLTCRKASPRFPQPLSSLFMYAVYAASVAPKQPPMSPPLHEQASLPPKLFLIWCSLQFVQYFLLIPTLRYKSSIAGSVVQEKNYFLHCSVCCLLKHKPKLQREPGQQKAQEIHVKFTDSYLHEVSSSWSCFCTFMASGSALECLCPIELLEFFQFTAAYNFYCFKIKIRWSRDCFLCSQ